MSDAAFGLVALIIGLCLGLCLTISKSLNKNTRPGVPLMDDPPPPPWLYGYCYEKVGDEWYLELKDISMMPYPERSLRYGGFQMTSQDLKVYLRTQRLKKVPNTESRFRAINFPTPKLTEA